MHNATNTELEFVHRATSDFLEVVVQLDSRLEVSEEEGMGKTKKSGLKVATLISTPNPVSQVLW